MLGNNVAVFLILAASAKIGFSSYIEVSTDVGIFIGHEYVSSFNRDKKNVQFLGIPYAEPPTGDRRFKTPVPKRPLSDAYNASSYGPSCSQPKIYLTDVEYSEDCLTLNIFAPVNAINGTETAVMVWIHGGGFIVGNSGEADPRNLASFGDVIIVSMNYRLDVFGFFSTGDTEAPGNYGLWDQQLAIQWVNLHIHKFGGDKDKITIFGQSAGSISVTYQMMYKRNKGLFNRAIAQSGSLFSWAATGKSSEKGYRKFLSLLGCNSRSTKEIVNCLRQKSANELLTTTWRVSITENLSFAPIVDGTFVDYDPANLYDSGREDAFERTAGIDYLMGICDIDGTIARGFVPQSTFINGTSKDFLENVVISQISNRLSKDKPIESLINNILVYKYKNHEDGSPLKRRTQLLDIVTDYFFTIPMFKSLWKHKNQTDSKAYTYLFGHQPFFSKVPMKGAIHSDDLVYVFGFSNFAESLANQSFSGMSNIPGMELNFTKAMMTYWSNFAKTGYPGFIFYIEPIGLLEFINPNMPVTNDIPTHWPEYRMAEQQFLDFGATFDDIKARDHMYADRVSLWMDLLPSIKSKEEKCYVSGSNGLFRTNAHFIVFMVMLYIFM